jgi:hypothetical protein
VAVVFPSKGCQSLINGCLQPIGTYIAQDVKLNIDDPRVTLMIRMVAVTVILSVMPINAAKTSVMRNRDQTTV